jgi:hypothetical protein
MDNGTRTVEEAGRDDRKNSSMISRPSVFSRIKVWIAGRLGLRRLFAATSYLLVRQLRG